MRIIEDETIKAVYRKVIVRAIQDHQGRVCSQEKNNRLLLKILSDEFLTSEDCIMICECVGLNYEIIMQNKDIPLKAFKSRTRRVKSRRSKHTLK